MTKLTSLMGLSLVLIVTFTTATMAKDTCLHQYLADKKPCSAAYKICRPNCHNLESSKVNDCLAKCEQTEKQCREKAKAKYNNCSG